MKKVIKGFLKALDYLEETFIVVCFAFMAIMNFINVASRYFFHYSFSSTEELTITAFVWITMFGAAAGYKRFAHLGMSYLVDKFSPKGQAIFVLFSMACSLVMILILVQYGFQMVGDQIRLQAKTPALGFPQAIQGVAIPVGGILIAIRTLQAGITQFTGLWKQSAGKKGATK